MSDSEQQPEVKPENVHVALKVSYSWHSLSSPLRSTRDLAHMSVLPL